jgi:hypothetical protein
MPRYDLHYQIVQPPQTNDPVPLPAGQIRQHTGANFTFDFKNPIAVRGLQKLANHWLKIFLTPKGTHPRRKNEGTDFYNLIGSNVDPDESLEGSVLLHIEDATQQLKDIQAKTPWRATDERLSTVNLLIFNQLSVDSIEIWVEVVNVAGTRLSVLIPYATTE